MPNLFPLKLFSECVFEFECPVFQMFSCCSNTAVFLQFVQNVSVWVSRLNLAGNVEPTTSVIFHVSVFPSELKAISHATLC